MAQRIRHINYKSDFSLIVTVPYLHGTATVLPEWDWWLTFKVGSVEKVFSQEGGVLSDGLKKVGDNKVEVFFDNHGFPTGTLVLEFSEKVPNTDYADGYKDTYAPQDLPVELWDSASDDYSPMAVNVYGSLEACVQNKVDKVDGKGLSTNDYTDAEKAKLESIVYDTELSESSENPVQNKVVYAANRSINSSIASLATNFNSMSSALGAINNEVKTKTDMTTVMSYCSAMYAKQSSLADYALKADYTTTADLQSNYYDKNSCVQIFQTNENGQALYQELRAMFSGYVTYTTFNKSIGKCATTETTTALQTAVDTINTELANTETLTFTLEDGSVVTKTFVVSNTTTE